MFSKDRSSLEISYRKDVRKTFYNPESGIGYDELKDYVFEKEHELLAEGRTYDEVRAQLLYEILSKARVGVNPAQRYADAFDAEGILQSLRDRRVKETQTEELTALEKKAQSLQHRLISFGSDWYHNALDWSALFRLGIPGIIERIQETAARKKAEGTLMDEQAGFYRACVTAYRAVITGFNRLADEADRKGAASGDFLRAITKRPPVSLDECLQLSLGMFRVLEFVDGTRTRSLGPVDRLFAAGYRHDIENGISQEECAEKLKYFLVQCWAMHVDYDLPLLIGGPEENEFSLLFVKTYTSLDIYSPKVHVRCAEESSPAFLKAVLSSIRSGNSSFVMINDEVAIKNLINCGEDPRDAADYLPIGCYEPYAYGKECGCSGGGSVRIAKAVELALFDGEDQLLHEKIGPATGDPERFSDFEEFYRAFYTQLKYGTELSMELLRHLEKLYGTRLPMALLSATYADAVEKGQDTFGGGAKYNNTAMNYMFIATAVDALTVIRACYEGKVPYSVGDLRKMLLADWQGYEKERRILDGLPRYGNGDEEADTLAKRVAKDCYELALKQPNGRGGVFKPALYSIDWGYRDKDYFFASADGRHTGDPLSKNLCACAGKDKKGITALMRSAAGLYLDHFPSGSVLDILLHPSSVSGDEGLDIMLGLYRTFFRNGGYAIHGNVMSAETMIAAQKDPESYANLQVRLCGWNVYFGLLTKTEQDDLIRAAIK